MRATENGRGPLPRSAATDRGLRGGMVVPMDEEAQEVPDRALTAPPTPGTDAA